MKKNRILIYPLIIMGALFLFTFSCTKDESSTSTTTVPVLTTIAVTDITATTATCGGNITSDGGATVTARGVCWSLGQTPTIPDSKTTDGTGAGTFASSITGLSQNTAYFVRAYATNIAGTGYGSAMSLTTPVIVTDIDGNVYNIITIGTQTWMVENLKTTKYRNGELIPNITDDIEWGNTFTGAYCDYENSPSNSATYDRLYNWYSVNVGNLCPTSWHVPSDSEWTILTSYLGGGDVAGGKLKETGTTHWQSPNTGATNESGFTALPSGGRNLFGDFFDLGDYAYFCSSTEYTDTLAWTRYLNYSGSHVNRNNVNKLSGLSVRCIKDNVRTEVD